MPDAGGSTRVLCGARQSCCWSERRVAVSNQAMKHALPGAAVVLLLVCAYDGMAQSVGDAQAAVRLGERFPGGRLVLDVAPQPHALWDALRQLNRLCACAIAYEEPEWRSRDDLELTRLPSGRGVPVQRTTVLHLELDVDGPLTPARAMPVLEALLAQHQTSGLSAEFDVLPGPPIQVRPSRVKDADGRVVPATSVLDATISLEADTATVYEWWQQLARAVSLASGRRVMAAFPPGNGPIDLARQRITFEAEAETGRGVLNRFTQALDREVAWSLSFTPATNSFTVGLWVGKPKVPWPHREAGSFATHARAPQGTLPC
jgi:hypothetical protein